MDKFEILEACYTVICNELHRASQRRDEAMNLASDTLRTAALDVALNDMRHLEELRKQVYWWKSTGKLLNDSAE